MTENYNVNATHCYMSFLTTVKNIVTTFLVFGAMTFLLCGTSEAMPFSNYRGINVYFHANPSEADFYKIDAWGVNLVRIFLHANPKRRDYDHIYQDDGYSFNNKTFLKIDHIIKIAADHNIKVIIATATYPGSTGKVWSDFRYWTKLVNLYEYISRRYKDNPTVIGYHPIDEPLLVRKHGSNLDRLLMRAGHWTFPDEWRGTTKDYFKLVEKVGQTINRIDPKKIVVVAGIGIWGFSDNYAWMESVNVQNTIYSFNPYIPAAFANSGKKGKPVVSYDSEKERSKLLEKMRPVQEFAKKNNVKIIVVGFGLPFHTEGMGARDWMNDMLSFFEENHWSWTYFSYGIPFRSPEIIERAGKGGKWLKSEETERLSILKRYWRLNSANEAESPNAYIR